MKPKLNTIGEPEGCCGCMLLIIVFLLFLCACKVLIVYLLTV